MGMIKKAILLTSIFALLAINTASAIPLPESSHYHGTSHFSSGGYLGYIDFAVYDTEVDGDVFADNIGDPTPGSGQYIYAYQIFSDSYNTIDYFSVLGIGEGAIADRNSDIGTVSDSPDDPGGQGVDVVDTTDAYFNLELTKGIWEFKYNGTHIIAGEHSVFLILRSNMDWTVGGYRFTPSDSDSVTVPGGSESSSTVYTPEPFTIALLGLGSFTLFYKRRKVVSYHIDNVGY